MLHVASGDLRAGAVQLWGWGEHVTLLEGSKMSLPGFLICYHVRANTGYAIEPLEITFFDVVSTLLDSTEQIHLGYSDYNNGKPRWLKSQTDNLIALRYMDMSGQQLDELSEYIHQNKIKYVLAFDLSAEASVCRALRKGGVKKIISYWGAPMSSLNSGLMLGLKRLQVRFTRNRLDHYIFESYGMQKAATHGRGIALDDTSVVRLGIDISHFAADKSGSYVYSELSIPAQRKVIFYAGHMEKRKGVAVIVKAAAELINERNRADVHFLICGNRNNEEKVFDEYYKGTEAEDYVTFAGYRSDIPELMNGCYAAVIASTGWDSFPRSSLEMSAAGLPLLVSDLVGLNETIEPGKSGLLFKTGDAVELADNIEMLLDAPKLREALSQRAVERVNKEFTLELQKQKLVEVLRQVITD